MKEPFIQSRFGRTITLPSRQSLPLWLLMVAASFLAASCVNIAARPTAVVDQSTPEIAVENLYRAFNTHDSAMFRALIDPDDPDREKLVQGFEKLMASGIVYEQSDLTMAIVESTSDMTRVRAYFRERITIDGELVNDEDSGAELTLVARNGRWYFNGLGQWPPPGWIVEPIPVPYATPQLHQILEGVP